MSNKGCPGAKFCDEPTKIEAGRAGPRVGVCGMVRLYICDVHDLFSVFRRRTCVMSCIVGNDFGLVRVFFAPLFRIPIRRRASTGSLKLLQRAREFEGEIIDLTVCNVRYSFSTRWRGLPVNTSSGTAFGRCGVMRKPGRGVFIRPHLRAFEASLAIIPRSVWVTTD